MVTMGDVAAQAGVSQATVSFVLGGRADRLKISRETRDRVLGAARDLGYQRNQLARAMVTGKSRIIGVLTTPQSGGDNIIRILTGAMEAAGQNDYLLKVVHLSYRGVDEATIARCLEWRLAGALVVGFSDEAHYQLNEAFHENNIPVSLIDNVPPVNWGIRIISDDEQGIGQVVSHLLDLGHRRIAYFGGVASPLSTWREKSLVAALTRAGLSVPPHWMRCTVWGNHTAIEADVKAFFDDCGRDLPTAVVCSADTMAMSVMRVARTRGLRLPEDLSVTGYSNANLSEFSDPPLTTIDQSFHDMGYAATLQVIGLAEGDLDRKTAHREVLLPTKLIVRGSTAPAPPALPQKENI